MNAEVDVRTWLTSTASVVASSAVFIGEARPALGVIPHKAIFVVEAGGWAPVDVFAGVSTTQFTRTVQVFVRGAPQDFAGGSALARAAFAQLHRGAIPGYLWCTAIQSAPMYLGMDNQGSPTWAFYVNLRSQG